MKTLRQMTAAALLTCFLAVSVSAGEMHTGYVPPPPPPPTDPPAASSETSEETGETEDGLTDLIAALLNGLLTVL